MVTGSADGGESVVEVPKRPLYEDICYEVVLRTVDRLGNRCDRSTATVTAKLLPSITGGKLPDGQISLPGPFDPARFLYLELTTGALEGASGLAQVPGSAALAVPHAAQGEQQRCEA